ncbi:hypothetical protein N8X69_00745, partial [Opitutales bacterium]|nr:hypothetical protein [Opitutales bacterium]
MKIKLLTSSFILLMLSSCIDDTETTEASQTAVVAQPPASVVSSGLSGQTVTFNPTLVFSADGLTINYTNTESGSNYPSGTSIDLNLTSEVVGDRLIVSITVGGEKIDLGFNFIDRGGEGYIDEVVLDLVEVDDEVQVLPAEISVLVTPGTIRNEKVAETALPDFTGAPTEAEWNQYLVGTAMLLQEDKMTYIDNTLVQFTTTSSGIYVDMEDGDTGTFTYSYSLTDSGANTGKITISSEWKNEDDTDTPDEEDLEYPGSNGHMLRDDFSKNLVFTNFYNGETSDNPGGTVTDTETGKVYPWNEQEYSSGTFKGITNPTVYLKNNTATN